MNTVKLVIKIISINLLIICKFVNDEFLFLNVFLTQFRRFRTIIRPYYRGAAGIVLAYDVTDEKTFRNIEDWTKNIAENTQSCQIIPKVLIANKTDLPYKSHHVQV